MIILRILFFTSFILLCNNAVASQSGGYKSCTSCTSVAEFKSAAENDYLANHKANRDQLYYYTVVNHTSGQAAFIKIWHYYEWDAEFQKYMSYTTTTSQTASYELSSDYQLSQELYTVSGDLQIVEITVDGTMGGLRHAGVKGYSQQISEQLKSHHFWKDDWRKLIGRGVIKVKLNDGDVAVFFKAINTTDMYLYLPGTAIDDSGNLVPVMQNGATADDSNGSSSGGGTAGIRTGQEGAAVWSINGGALACTYVDGMLQSCWWIHIP